MKRYVLRKYVEAENIIEAIALDAKTVVEDCWLDEKQPEKKEQTSQIGFSTENEFVSYSPILKPKKRAKKKTH